MKLEGLKKSPFRLVTKALTPAVVALALLGSPSVHAVSSELLESMETLSNILPSGTYSGKSITSGNKCTIQVEYSMMEAKAQVRASEDDHKVSSLECDGSNACFAFSGDVSKTASSSSGYQFVYDNKITEAKNEKVSAVASNSILSSDMQISITKKNSFMLVEVKETQEDQQSQISCAIPL